MSRIDVARFGFGPGMPALLRALGAGEGRVRLVGGCVRDAMLGDAIGDIDMAARLQPEEVMERLDAAGIKCIPTGFAHGTVTAVLAEGPVEVTTLRRDVETDGRHAIIAYTDDWQEDAARRDFTMNALYADPLTGELFDYFGGLDDLRERRVRFIGDARQRIAEDYLRILRFFRFTARFSPNNVDPQGLAACVDLAGGMEKLSGERVREEILRLLAHEGAPSMIAVMERRGVLAMLLPADQGAAERLARLATAEAALGLGDERPIRRLGVLLRRSDAAARRVADRLRLSRREATRLLLMLSTELVGGSAPLRERAYRAGRDVLLDRLLLSHAWGGDQEHVDEALLLTGIELPVFPLSGRDVTALGVPAGPRVGDVLRTVEEEWIAAGFPAADQLRAILKATADPHIRSSS